MKQILDISKWNGDIDFGKLKSEVYGVIIRVGYRGYRAAGTIVAALRGDPDWCAGAEAPEFAGYHVCPGFA